jgi:hypothetical protein
LKEVIDLDLELLKMKAFEEEQAKNIIEPNFKELREKCYNLEFLTQYMDLNEDIFEEIHDLLVSVENKAWYRYTDALERIREILLSRIYFLDGMIHPKTESDNNLCL